MGYAVEITASFPVLGAYGISPGIYGPFNPRGLSLVPVTVTRVCSATIVVAGILIPPLLDSRPPGQNASRLADEPPVTAPAGNEVELRESLSYAV
jgi:hypothetical protein